MHFLLQCGTKVAQKNTFYYNKKKKNTMLKLGCQNNSTYLLLCCWFNIMFVYLQGNKYLFFYYYTRKDWFSCLVNDRSRNYHLVSFLYFVVQPTIIIFQFCIILSTKQYCYTLMPSQSHPRYTKYFSYHTSKDCISCFVKYEGEYYLFFFLLCWCQKQHPFSTCFIISLIKIIFIHIDATAQSCQVPNISLTIQQQLFLLLGKR